MKESRVLIINLNNACTELARHLVLSGINLNLVDASADLLVEAHHVESDFLFSQSDIGHQVIIFQPTKNL